MDNIVSNYQDKDDAVHPFDSANYYEWWYLDGVFENGYTFAHSCFWRTIVGGLRVPVVLMHIYTPEGKKLEGADGFNYADCRASLDKCNVAMGKNYIRQEGDLYKLSVHALNVGAELTYKGMVPGWKWSEDCSLIDDATGKHGWANALPRADVTGNLFIDGKAIPVKGEGYHDHNWGNVLMSDSMTGWIWGRMFHKEYTFVYFYLMPLNDETGIRSALFLARGDVPIFASSAMKFTMGKNILHGETGNSIPTDIVLEGSSGNVDVHCRLDVVKVLDAIVSEPDPNGHTSYYYRRLNKYDARITVDGKTITIAGDAINEHVLLR